MPLLMFEDGQRVQFKDELRLGSDADWSHVVLPGAAPQHALLTRSTFNQLLMVVALDGKMRVNAHPVTRLRVLRQGDRLQMAGTTLTVAEVQITRLAVGDAAVGQKCPVSRRVLQVGDEVIACPGCGTVHEKDAWFLIERCAAGCGYPNRQVVLDTLPVWLMVERSLDDESRLVERINNGRVIQEGVHCEAGQSRDQVPFQRGQNAVFCPDCQSPFHLECFLTLPACPVCGYDIQAMLNDLFLAEEAAP